MLPQVKYYRQRFIKYAIKNGVTKASLRYKVWIGYNKLYKKIREMI